MDPRWCVLLAGAEIPAIPLPPWRAIWVGSTLADLWTAQQRTVIETQLCNRLKRKQLSLQILRAVEPVSGTLSSLSRTRQYTGKPARASLLHTSSPVMLLTPSLHVPLPPGRPSPSLSRPPHDCKVRQRSLTSARPGMATPAPTTDKLPSIALVPRSQLLLNTLASPPSAGVTFVLYVLSAYTHALACSHSNSYTKLDITVYY